MIGESGRRWNWRRGAELRPRRPADGRASASRPAASASVPFGSRCRMSGRRSSSRQHGKAVDQRPGARDGGGLRRATAPVSEICSWRLAPIAPASPANEAFGGLVQRWPRHVETLGAEHQPVHAGMRLRIGDIGLGPRQRLFQWRGARGGTRRHHRGVELPEPDRGEFADETGEIAEMMGRRGMRHAGFARHRAQRQSREPVAFEYRFRRLEQGVAQRAVMIGRVFAGCGRAPFPPAARRAALPEAGRTRVGVLRGDLLLGALAMSAL